jgi:hypothetical protein
MGGGESVRLRIFGWRGDEVIYQILEEGHHLSDNIAHQSTQVCFALGRDHDLAAWFSMFKGVLYKHM